MEGYAIINNGMYLSSKIGWGPTFTMFSQDAKLFKTPADAWNYIAEYLPDFGCGVGHLYKGETE